jgi:hypothetical protein
VDTTHMSNPFANMGGIHRCGDGGAMA